MNELTIKKELEVLDESKAKQIEKTFAPMVEMLKSFEGQYDQVMEMEQSPEKCARAKRLRLDIARVRIDADKVRKEQKEQYLRAGNAIQGVYNILKFAVTDKEESLKSIEEYYKRIEEEKVKKLQAEREAELQRYEVDGTQIDLGNMTDDVWSNFLTGSKANYEARVAAERKAEEARREAERKVRLWRDRKDELAMYAHLGAYDDLTVETTESEYQNIKEAMQAKQKEYETRQARIRKENEELRKQKEKAETERRKLQEKAERERKQRLEEERRQREAAEREKAEKVPDKEKLLRLANDILAAKGAVKSAEAKQAIKKAYDILAAAAGEL